MASRVAFVVIGVGAWLGLGLLTGCNEILDIQQAELGTISGAGASSAGSGAGGGLQVPGGADACKADNSACSACISTHCSGGEQSQCTSKEDCRRIGDHYATCLGAGCKADELGCFEPLFADDSLVPKCVIKSCSSECAAVPVYSACELYCGCMLTNCQGKFETVAQCVTACKLLDPELVNCRRTHCEIAAYDTTLRHCDHAVGIDTCFAPPTRPTDCRNKSLKGFYCATNSDCCSSWVCDPDKKACVDP